MCNQGIPLISQTGSQLAFQVVDDPLSKDCHFLVGQSPIARLVSQSIGQALSALARLTATVYIKQADLAHQCSTCLPDGLLNPGCRDIFFDDERQIFDYGWEDRKWADFVVAWDQRYQALQGQLTGQDRVGRQLIVLLDERVQFAKCADGFTIEDQAGTSAGMESRDIGWLKRSALDMEMV